MGRAGLVRRAVATSRRDGEKRSEYSNKMLQFAIVCKGHGTRARRKGHGRVEVMLWVVGMGVWHCVVIAGCVWHMVVGGGGSTHLHEHSTNTRKSAHAKPDPQKPKECGLDGPVVCIVASFKVLHVVLP